MKKVMTKEEFLVEAKKSIRATFGTYIEAASYFGITREALRYGLDGEGKHVPQYLLNFMGCKAVENIVRVKNELA